MAQLEQSILVSGRVTRRELQDLFLLRGILEEKRGSLGEATADQIREWTHTAVRTMRIVHASLEITNDMWETAGFVTAAEFLYSTTSGHGDFRANCVRRTGFSCNELTEEQEKRIEKARVRKEVYVQAFDKGLEEFETNFKTFKQSVSAVRALPSQDPKDLEGLIDKYIALEDICIDLVLQLLPGRTFVNCYNEFCSTWDDWYGSMITLDDSDNDDVADE